MSGFATRVEGITYRRPWTDPVSNEGGGHTFVVKRCCDLCERPVGDVSSTEAEALIEGHPLPAASLDCPWCTPSTRPVAQERTEQMITERLPDADDPAAMRAEIARLRAREQAIFGYACEVHWLPFVNGAVASDDPDCLMEAKRLADALHMIGWLIAPEQFVTPVGVFL